MNGPIILQGIIHDSERDFHCIQDIVQSLPPDTHLHHTLRNVQHSELLRMNMLRTSVATAWRGCQMMCSLSSVLALLRVAVTLYRRDEQPQANDPRVDEFLRWLARQDADRDSLPPLDPIYRIV